MIIDKKKKLLLIARKITVTIILYILHKKRKGKAIRDRFGYLKSWRYIHALVLKESLR